MKIINLIIGAVFIWLGGERITFEKTDDVGRVLLVVGIVTILSAFSSSNGSGSGWGGDSGSGWGDSGGGDCGGGD
ncbi:hypothetical protein L3081_02470 [Colwellia sp. MSW7]|uniref:Uncharacterized protein n=1 Tax=Colwellia maritima TaxID=2912588 RepID=A0ABS9WX52_9GAMM|nr:hypothetical protein [Colwellia maritima]MCI2282466.1 hypothetical protein [Colwellia maritima]